MLMDRISPQSEVIGAILLGDSPFCGGPRTSGRWSTVSCSAVASPKLRRPITARESPTHPVSSRVTGLPSRCVCLVGSSTQTVAVVPL